MNPAEITPRLTSINTIWQWLVVWSMMCIGWMSREQFAEIVASEGDGTLVVYDKDGNGVLLVPDDVAGRQSPFQSHVDLDDKALWELDLALMKPSCCDAPEGLSHFWYRPNCIGTLPTIRPGHPGQGARAADPGSPRGPIP